MNCEAENCARDVMAKGLCKPHYNRVRNKSIDPLSPIRRRDGKQGCCIQGCNRKHCSRGYCKNHFQTLNYQERKLQLVHQFGNICTDCRRTYPAYVFDFDCTIPDRDHINIGYLLDRTASWERLAKELAKCEMVCSNCHRTRTHERLYNQGARCIKQHRRRLL